MTDSILNATSTKPRLCIISTHGYVAATPPLGAADTGGQVVYVLELSKKLAQLGYEVDIWTRQFENQPRLEPVAEGVRIIRTPCGNAEFIPKEYLYLGIPEWCEHAQQFIKQNGLSYQFINSHYWDAGWAGRSLAEALKIPHVHTPHSLGTWKRFQMAKDYPDQLSDFERRYNFAERILHERSIYRDATLLVATTPEQMDVIAKDYKVPMASCRMIPPGYDDTRFYSVSEASRKAIRDRLGWEGRNILCLGRLARNKGYDLLLNAFPLILERVPDAVLHLPVGGEDISPREQELLSELKAQASALGVQERVRFSGFIHDEELPDHYRAADVFVLPSRYEPFGMTAVEAMASGSPTVVTTKGGLWRALTFGRHALTANPLDREDLGITISKVFLHPRLRARLGRMGAHKARSLFTWTGIAQQLLAAVEHGTGEETTFYDGEWDEPWNDSD